MNWARGTLLGNVTAEPIDTGVVEAATAVAPPEDAAENDVTFEDALGKLVVLHPRLEETVIPAELQTFELYVTATARSARQLFEKCEVRQDAGSNTRL